MIERRIDITNKKEVDNLIADLSLIIGMLRGILYSHEKDLPEHQIKLLEKVDTQINKIFYK